MAQSQICGWYRCLLYVLYCFSICISVQPSIPTSYSNLFILLQLQLHFEPPVLHQVCTSWSKACVQLQFRKWGHKTVLYLTHIVHNTRKGNISSIVNISYYYYYFLFYFCPYLFSSFSSEVLYGCLG